MVLRSQPDFQMGERTVPIEHLNHEGEDKTREMEDLYSLILDAPKGAQKEKDDPEKMDQHQAISKNLVEHYFRRSLRDHVLVYHRTVSFQRKA
jgi:hypothetical protein